MIIYMRIYNILLYLGQLLLFRLLEPVNLLQQLGSYNVWEFTNSLKSIQGRFYSTSCGSDHWLDNGAIV